MSNLTTAHREAAVGGVPFAARIGGTPVVSVGVPLDRVGGHRPSVASVLLKLEAANPGGSIKARTAYALIRSLESNGCLRPGQYIVESTSGNLGVALAEMAQELGYGFIAVVDPKASPSTLDRLVSLGAEVELVSQPDGTGGFLLTRLARVRALLEQNRGLAWTDQYRNAANPRVHFEQTGPEVIRQCGRPAAVFVAVSTGGTLAGVGRYCKAVSPGTAVVGVDVYGSRVFGSVTSPRLLNGIGSSQPSAFLRTEHFDDVELVTDADAIGACHVARDQLGLSLGGSSGAVLAACVRWLKRRAQAGLPWADRPVVCLCPDDAVKYADTIYNPAWLTRHGIPPDNLPRPQLLLATEDMT